MVNSGFSPVWRSEPMIGATPRPTRTRKVSSCSAAFRQAATAAVIDPEIFIIGGGVSKAGQFLVDRVQSYFVKYAWPGIRGIKFALAELGNDAGIYGAASIVIDK
jgi:hypothetical protein